MTFTKRQFIVPLAIFAVSVLLPRFVFPETVLKDMPGPGKPAEMGGNFAPPVHIDCVMLKPTLTVDGQMILKDGEFQI